MTGQIDPTGFYVWNTKTWLRILLGQHKASCLPVEVSFSAVCGYWSYTVVRDSTVIIMKLISGLLVSLLALPAVLAAGEDCNYYDGSKYGV